MVVTRACSPSIDGMELSTNSLDDQIERLKRCEHLKETEVKALCLKAREILVDESNVQRVDAPVTVRGVVFLLWADSLKK